MRRAVIFLLVACAVLAMGSAAGGLARAASGAVSDRFQALKPAETPSPNFFVYLPLVFRNTSSGPTWVSVVDEGFEGSSGEMWKFYDQNQPQQGSYYWGRRDCRPYTGTHSAWAVGGGTVGSGLPCYSGYPANADSRMEYGPFSLQDATDAYWRFSLWLDRGGVFDTPDFCWYAWSSNTVVWEDCLTIDTGTWYTWTVDLSDPAIDVLGESQVWIGFRFTSLSTGSQAEGAYVDDVVVRKCVGGICPASSSSVPAPAAGRAERTLGSPPVKSSSYSSGR
jgi:hypothetical protein